MMEIELINQRKSNDCSLACVAMAAGVSYEDAEKAFNGESPPYGMEKSAEALARLSCWLDASCLTRMWKDNIYILTVPSLNFSGLTHAIVVHLDKKDTVNVYDPNAGISGKKYYKDFHKLSWASAERVVRCY